MATKATNTKDDIPRRGRMRYTADQVGYLYQHFMFTDFVFKQKEKTKHTGASTLGTVHVRAQVHMCTDSETKLRVKCQKCAGLLLAVPLINTLAIGP